MDFYHYQSSHTKLDNSIALSLLRFQNLLTNEVKFFPISTGSSSCYKNSSGLFDQFHKFPLGKFSKNFFSVSYSLNLLAPVGFRKMLADLGLKYLPRRKRKGGAPIETKKTSGFL